MSNPSYVYNFGAEFKAADGGAVYLVAGGAEDGAEYASLPVSRSGFQSGKLTLNAHGALAAGQSLEVKGLVVETTTDGGLTWSQLFVLDEEQADQANVMALTFAPAGGSAFGDAGSLASFNINFLHAQDDLRVRFVPSLSAADTDTASISVTWCLGGAQRHPIPE